MRLIDADALIAQMEADYEQMGDPIAKMFTYAAIADMKRATTVDAVPVRRGKWLPIIEVNEYGEPYQSGVYCSECGETSIYEPNYCPNCGARMVEDE